MSLRIHKDGNYLDLNPKTVLQLEIKSPFYFGERSSDSLPGIKTYKIKVPATSKNRLLLDRPEALDNPNNVTMSSGWYIQFGTNIILEGIAKVTQSTDEQDYDLQLITGIAGAMNVLKSKYLTELDFASITPSGDILTHANDNNSTNLSTAAEYYPTILLSEENHIKWFNFHNGTAYSNTTTDEDSDTVPMFRLNYTLQKIFETIGYSVIGEVITDVELGKLIVFSNRVLDDPTEIKPAEHLPKIKANKFISNISNLFCAGPILDHSEKSCQIIHAKNLKNRPIVNWDNKIEKIGQTKSLKNIADGIELSEIDSLSKTEWTSPPEFAYLEEHDDLSTLDYFPSVPSTAAQGFYFIKSFNTIYRKSHIVAGIEVVFKPKHQEIATLSDKNAKTPFKINVGTLFMNPQPTTHTNDIGDWIYTPQYKEEIVSLETEGKTIEKIGLLYFRGLEGTGNRPLATNGKYSADESIVGTNELLIEDIYNTYWKDWLATLANSKTISYKVHLNSTDLEQLDLSKRYKIGKHYLIIKKVQLSISMTSILPATIEFLILKS